MSNGLLSTVRDLARRRARRRRDLTLAEGIRLVEEVLEADASIRGIVTAPMLEASERGRALKARLARVPCTSVEVTDPELVELADTEHPQGVIAVVQPPTHTLEDIAVSVRRPVLVIDRVQDPGNVGALCRMGWGLGAAGVVALPGTAELFGPKALRGSMGALFHLPAVRSDDDALVAWLRRHDIDLWVATRQGTPVSDVDFGTSRVALVVGNEGAGPHQALMQHASATVAVPLAPSVESLNVAVAAGILLYEVVRER